MPKKVRTAQLDRNVVAVVSKYPEGIEARKILPQVQKGLNLRTLQRLLAALVEENCLKAVGKGKARRYKLPVWHPGNNPRISAQGVQIQQLVRRPRYKRNAVGYHIPCLREYRPNVDFYIYPSDRNEMRSLGAVPEPQRLSGGFVRDISPRLTIDFSWASSYLSGNTYTYQEVERLIEGGIATECRTAAETLMILNHRSVLDFLLEELEGLEFSPTLILNLHAMISDGLVADPIGCGRIRKRPLKMRDSVYQPQNKPGHLKCLSLKVIEKVKEISDPFEQAFFTLVHLSYLQPFEVMNESLSRVIANIILVKNGFYPLSFIDVSKSDYDDALFGVFEHCRYELLRDIFIYAYKSSCDRYSSMNRQIVIGDDFRLQNRSYLTAAIRKIVLEKQSVSKKATLGALPSHLSRETQVRFLKILKDELENLYPGNAMRFGLSPQCVAEWKEFTSEE